MRRRSVLLPIISTLLFSSFIPNTENIDKEVDENNIRTVVYKEKEKKEESFYDVKSYLDEDNKYITKCKRDFNLDMISNIDNVSLSKLDEYIGETVDYEIIFDVNNMKYYLTVFLESYNEEKYTLEGTIIQNDQNINIVFEDDEGNKFYLSNLKEKNSIDSVGFFKYLIPIFYKSLARIAYETISCVLPSATADMIWNLANNILGGESGILGWISRISSAITNYIHNKNKGEPDMYIYNQRNEKVADYRLGHWQPLGEKGCGVVAMYNVLRQMNKTTNLRDIILRLDIMDGYTGDLKGLAGVSPACISSVMALSGVWTTKYAYWQVDKYDNDYYNKNSIILIENGFPNYHYYSIYIDWLGQYRSRNGSLDNKYFNKPSDTINREKEHFVTAYVFK